MLSISHTILENGRVHQSINEEHRRMKVSQNQVLDQKGMTLTTLWHPWKQVSRHEVPQEYICAVSETKGTDCHR